MPTCSARVAATSDLVNAFAIKAHCITKEDTDNKLKGR